MRVFVLLATWDHRHQTLCFLFAGLVPECAREVAANGDEAGKQDGGQVLAGRLAGDGHVPRVHGVDPVAAAA